MLHQANKVQAGFLLTSVMKLSEYMCDEVRKRFLSCRLVLTEAIRADFSLVLANNTSQTLKKLPEHLHHLLHVAAVWEESVTAKL